MKLDTNNFKHCDIDFAFDVPISDRLRQDLYECFAHKDSYLKHHHQGFISNNEIKVRGLKKPNFGYEFVKSELQSRSVFGYGTFIHKHPYVQNNADDFKDDDTAEIIIKFSVGSVEFTEEKIADEVIDLHKWHISRDWNYSEKRLMSYFSTESDTRGFIVVPMFKSLNMDTKTAVSVGGKTYRFFEHAEIVGFEADSGFAWIAENYVESSKS